MKRLLVKLGIPCPKRMALHAFRHGLATELLRDRTPFLDLQKQMRHADVNTTIRLYGHVIPKSQRTTMERIAKRAIRTSPIRTKGPISTKKQT